jgi:large subunit ribosomal protein L22
MEYATKLYYNPETMAKAQAVSLPISLKQASQVCRFIRNKKYDAAVKLLQAVIEVKVAVPGPRGFGHKVGMASGRYPVKVSKYVLALLKSTHANAVHKGLDTNKLIIRAAVAKPGPKVSKPGRKRGRTAKRTHVELVAEVIQDKKTDMPEKKQENKKEQK